MSYRRAIVAPAILALAALAGPGCGGQDTVWVKGRLLKGGSPYLSPEDQKVNVTLVALEARDASGKPVQAGEMFAAEYNPSDSRFEVPGRERQGIPPGRYRVAVTQRMEREALDAAREKIKDKARKQALTRETDMLADRYGLATSPIVVEVNRTEELAVDLDSAATSPGGASAATPAKSSRDR